MKIKLELELPEADAIFRALKIIDPHTIFTANLIQRLVEAAKPAEGKEKK